MDKEKVKNFLRDNNKPLIVVVGGLILSVILSSTDVTFLQFLAPLMQIGCVVYAVLFYRAKNKKNEELKKAKEAQLKEEEAAAINDFKNTLDATVNNILTVILEEPNTTNFEQGLEHAIKNSAVPLKVEDVLPLAQQSLLTRMSKNGDNDPAAVILIIYFCLSMRWILLGDYMTLAIREENPSQYADIQNERLNEAKIPFLKTLYGFSVRAYNYYKSLNNPIGYTPIDDEFLENLVTTDDVISSYCKSNPFETEKMKAEWINDIKKAAYAAVSSDRLKIDLNNNEKLLDALCYHGYSIVCKSNEKDLESIVANFLSTIKDEYAKINK